MQNETVRPLWQRVFFSEVILEKSRAQKIAWIAVTAALCVIANFSEFKFADIQFSFTIFASVLAGMVAGPLPGALSAMLGDFLGFAVNSGGYLYMVWIGLSCACMALISGLVMKLPLRFRGSGYVKLALVCVLVLLVCTVGINTTGFYFYYTGVGFTSKSLALIEEHFGANSYLAYALVRLFFMGQIWNSLFNYALLFLCVPILNAVKPLKINIR